MYRKNACPVKGFHEPVTTQPTNPRRHTRTLRIPDRALFWSTKREDHTEAPVPSPEPLTVLVGSVECCYELGDQRSRSPPAVYKRRAAVTVRQAGGWLKRQRMMTRSTPPSWKRFPQCFSRGSMETRPLASKRRYRVESDWNEVVEV